MRGRPVVAPGTRRAVPGRPSRRPLHAGVATALAVAAGLVAAPSAGAVLGGADAPQGTADSTVRIDLPHDVCSGSVVAPRLVLTALHCVQAAQDGVAPDVLARDATVTVGDPNGGGRVQERHAVGAIVAPQARPAPQIAGQVDAVLLILDRPVGAHPAPLAPPADTATALTAGHPLVLSGFGATSSPGVGRDGVAKAPVASAHLKVAAMTAAACPGGAATSDLQACAGPAATDAGGVRVGTACAGDSGAPVSATGSDGVVRQVAVLSGAVGPDVCSQTDTIVLTPVSASISAWVAGAATGRALPAPGPVPSRCRTLRRTAAAAARGLRRARRSAERRHRSSSAARSVRRAESRSRRIADAIHRIC